MEAFTFIAYETGACILQPRTLNLRPECVGLRCLPDFPGIEAVWVKVFYGPCLDHGREAYPGSKGCSRTHGWNVNA